MQRPPATMAPAVLGLLCACSAGSPPAATSFTTASTSTAATLGESEAGLSSEDDDSSSTANESTSGDGDGDEAGDGDGEPLKLDVVGDSTTGMADDGGMDTGCSKVDLILSVDASSSMQAELDSLFDTFLEVKEILANEVGMGIDDFHVAVMNACNDPAYFHNWAAGHTNCNFPVNQNWLASNDAMLDARFECVIDIPFQDEALQGNGGDNGGYNGMPDYCADGPDEDEQPALAAAAAIQPNVTQNAGMVRDDAILFVVAITDEDEALANVNSAGQIHDLYMQVKDPGEVVFLGIGGTDCPSAYDGGNVNDSTALASVAAEFGQYGLFRTMCSGQSDDPIRDAFIEALTSIVDQACDEFTPPE